MPVPHVVSFGETMLRFSPRGGTRLEEARDLGAYVAGAESNTLVCLARLGLRATWLSALPDSPLGRRVSAELRGHGVDTSKVAWDGSGSRLGIFYAEEAEAPLGNQVYYDRAASAFALMRPESLDFRTLTGASFLHLTGITPALGEGPLNLFARLLREAKAAAIHVSFDVNYRAKLWGANEAAIVLEEACREADLLFCTRQEAATLWGLEGSAEEIVRRLDERFRSDGEKTIVLTLGAGGAAELREGKYSEEPSFATGGSHRFGSGDAFAGGYIYAYLQMAHSADTHADIGATPLRYANAVAALKRCIPGDLAVITPAEVEAVLRGNTGAVFR